MLQILALNCKENMENNFMFHACQTIAETEKITILRVGSFLHNTIQLCYLTRQLVGLYS
jgi:hypothetical protein